MVLPNPGEIGCILIVTGLVKGGILTGNHGFTHGFYRSMFFPRKPIHLPILSAFFGNIGKLFTQPVIASGR
jgi:hypothetical protein